MNSYKKSKQIMSKILTKNQINFFHENGFLSPIKIMRVRNSSFVQK